MTERHIQNDILRDLGARPDIRLFRQNVGEAWVGVFVSFKNGRLILDNARRFFAGLCVGSSDLIGWRTVVVTPDMVGQRVAIFTGIEVKAPRGSPTTEQRAFTGAVNSAGGRAGFARSVDEARIIVGAEHEISNTETIKRCACGRRCEAASAETCTACAALHRVAGTP